MERFGYDIPSGVVIGEIETREYYRFYSEKDGRLLYDLGRADNDKQAIELFWAKFAVDPWLIKEYKADGVEMRIWK